MNLDDPFNDDLEYMNFNEIELSQKEKLFIIILNIFIILLCILSVIILW